MPWRLVDATRGHATSEPLRLCGCCWRWSVVCARVLDSRSKALCEFPCAVLCVWSVADEKVLSERISLSTSHFFGLIVR